MKWRIQGQKAAFVVDLPDAIIDRQPFSATVNGEVYQALWHRNRETLFLTEPATGKEIVVRSRYVNLETNPDEAETGITLEYLDQCGQISAFSAVADFHVPGLTLKKSADTEQGATVRAPMAGKVLSVRVKEGQKVDKGEALCVIEAMKMENLIAAPKGGVIKSLHIKAGEQVSVRAKLIVIQ